MSSSTDDEHKDQTVSKAAAAAAAVADLECKEEPESTIDAAEKEAKAIVAKRAELVDEIMKTALHAQEHALDESYEDACRNIVEFLTDANDVQVERGLVLALIKHNRKRKATGSADDDKEAKKPKTDMDELDIDESVDASSVDEDAKTDVDIECSQAAPLD